MSITTTEYFMVNLLTDLTDHVSSGNFDGALHGAHVMLFTNQPVLSRQTTVTDLTECVYTGYARQAVVWGVPYYQPDNSLAINSDLLIFTPSDDVVPESVSGYAVVSSTSGTPVLFAELFSTPIPLPDALHSLNLSVQYATVEDNASASATVVS